MAAGKDIKAGGAFVELTLTDKKFQQGLKNAESRLRAVGNGVGAIGTQLAAVGAIAIGAGIAFAQSFANFGDQLDKASKRTGIAVERLSALQYAAGQSGASVEDLENGVRKMQKTIVDAASGTATAVDALDALGLSVSQVSQLKPDEQFRLIADRLSLVADPTERAALAMDVFGKSGTKLLPLLENGAKGIEALEAEAVRVGRTMTTEAASAAAAYGDELDRMTGAIRQVGVAIGVALVPTLQAAAGWIKENAIAAIAWVQQNKEMIVLGLKVAAVLGATGAAFLAISKIFLVLAAAAKFAGVAMAALHATLTFSSLGGAIAIIAAVAAGVYALAKAMQRSTAETDGLIKKTQELAAAGQKQRAEDELRLQRLKQLAEKHRLTNEEMGEAKRLTAELQGRYGDLGITIDETAQSLRVAASAQEALSVAMRATAAIQLDSAMRPLLDQLEKVNGEIAKTKQNLEGSDRWFRGFTNFTTDLPNLEKLLTEQADLIAEIGKLKRTRDGVLGGDRSALVGEPDAEGPDTRSNIVAEQAARKQAAAEAQNAEKELARLEDQRAKRRRTNLENELADIKTEAAERRRLLTLLLDAEKAKGDKADPGKISDMERARSIVDVQERGDVERANNRAADEAEKEKFEIEERARQDRLTAEQQLNDDIARLRIESTMEGMEKELALLELERQAALEEARAAGVDSNLVNRKFDLQADLIRGGDAASEATSSVRGTFSASALQSLQTNTDSKRIAKAVEETATNTKKLLAKVQPLRFA